jgi:hypothetical protein
MKSGVRLGGVGARLSRAPIALQQATEHGPPAKAVVPCGQYRSLVKGHDYTTKLT